MRQSREMKRESNSGEILLIVEDVVTRMTRMARISKAQQRAAKDNRTWGVAKAKACLSTVIECALSEGPQTITRSGHKAVIVVAADEWERKTKRKGNLVEFFASSPLRGSGVRIKRSGERARRIVL